MPATQRSEKVPTRSRVLNLDLLAWKPGPLAEAEAVITFLSYVQVIAPQVWSDLITRAESATTPGDLPKAAKAWAAEWRLCGPTGPTEWAGVDLILDIDLNLREQPSVADEVSILWQAPNGH
jgi:hypothetical protein